MYFNTQTKQVYETLYEIRQSFENITLPENISDEFLLEFNIVPVVATTPDYNKSTQTVEQDIPSESNGVWYQEWKIIDLPEDVVKENQRLDQEQKLQQAKIDRAKEVQDVVVTTASGKDFNGDEVSQSRMARAILSLNPQETTLWVLANGVPDFHVTREELQEALRLAGTMQTTIWLKPYNV